MRTYFGCLFAFLWQGLWEGVELHVGGGEGEEERGVGLCHTHHLITLSAGRAVPNTASPLRAITGSMALSRPALSLMLTPMASVRFTRGNCTSCRHQSINLAQQTTFRRPLLRGSVCFAFISDKQVSWLSILLPPELYSSGSLCQFAPLTTHFSSLRRLLSLAGPS